MAGPSACASCLSAVLHTRSRQVFRAVSPIFSGLYSPPLFSLAHERFRRVQVSGKDLLMSVAVSQPQVGTGLVPTRIGCWANSTSTCRHRISYSLPGRRLPPGITELQLFYAGLAETQVLLTCLELSVGCSPGQLQPLLRTSKDPASDPRLQQDRLCLECLNCLKLLPSALRMSHLRQLLSSLTACRQHSRQIQPHW